MSPSVTYRAAYEPGLYQTLSLLSTVPSSAFSQPRGLVTLYNTIGLDLIRYKLKVSLRTTLIVAMV